MLGSVRPGRVTNILQRVDTLGGLLDLTANDLGDQLGGQLSQRAAGGLALHYVGHLLADHPDLRRPGVGGLLDLVGASLREGNGKQADQILIGRLDRHVGLDQGLPLAHKRAQLVRRKVHAVEVGQAVLPLDLVHPELDLAESMVLVVLQIREGSLEHTALEVVVGVLKTAGAVDDGLADAWSRLAGYSMGTRFKLRRTYSRIWKVDGAWSWVSPV